MASAATITKRQYVEYLVSTVANFTNTHLAEHLDGAGHDTVTDSVYPFSPRKTGIPNGTGWRDRIANRRDRVMTHAVLRCILLSYYWT